MFVSLVYPPVGQQEQENFHKTLTSIWEEVPSKYHHLGGHNINASVGIRENMIINQ